MDHRLLEASPDCVKLLTPSGQISYVNANGLCLLDIADVDAIKGRDWVNLWPPAAHQRVRKTMTDANSGITSRFTEFGPTASGSPKWWDVVVSPVFGDDGAVFAVLAISRDITQMKAVEETRQESEQRFRALANTIPQLAWMADRNGVVFWYNQRWFDYTGATFDEMKGLGWTSVHHPDHVERVVTKFQRSLASGEPWEDLFPLRRADGEYRWFLSRALPQFDATGVPILYCGTNTDVTDQRSQTERLRQLARIVDLSHEAILVWELDGGIVEWNRGCVELYGYSKSEALGQRSHDLLQTRLPVPAVEFDKLLLAEGGWSGELLHVANDGSQVWVESRQEVIRVRGRRLVLETNRDISERRRADETRNLLIAELNHRVKNMLAIVQSLATQTARTATTVPQYLASFNDRLQSLSSAYAVLTDSNWRGASIAELCKAILMTVAELGPRITIEGNDVFLPPQTALQLTLVLHELATNAVKHGALSTPAGTVDIRWDQKPGNDRAVLLTWQERGGPSIPDDVVNGFGLNLIEKSGRSPNLKASISFPCGGAKATIELAQIDGSSHESLFNPGRGLSRFREAARTSSMPGRRRVLIVDPDASEAMLVEDILFDAGYITVGPVGTLAEVTRKLSLVRLDGAIVDIDGLKDEATAIIDAIQANNVSCLLAGSERELLEMVDLAPNLSRLTKPLIADQVLTAFALQIGRPLTKPEFD